MTNNVKNYFKQGGSGSDNDLMINGNTVYGKDSIITAIGDSDLSETDYTTRMRQFITNALSSGNASPYNTKGVDYTLTTSDYDVEFTASGITATLPSAIGHNNEHRIDNSSDGSITLASDGGLIQGEATQTILSNNSITVRSNGTNWRVK